MPERIENPMIIDSLWESQGSEPERSIEEKLNGPGWVDIESGIFISKEDAFDYALKQCVEIAPKGLSKILWTDEFKEMLVEWFYSNWILEE